jgi:predicted transcriptional regulator of viral defense system
MITAAEVQRQTGLKPATLRKWVQRGKVRRYGNGAYDIDDIAAELRRTARTKRTELDTPSDPASHSV